MRRPRFDRVLDEPDRGVRIATELARQVDDRVRIAERNAQQQPDARATDVELGDFLGIVDNEGRDATVERMTDVRAALDRVRVDAAAWRDAGVPNEIHLAIRREVEPGAFARKHLHDCPVGQRLQCVVQVHTWQRLRKRMVLVSERVAVDHEQR